MLISLKVKMDYIDYIIAKAILLCIAAFFYGFYRAYKKSKTG